MQVGVLEVVCSAQTGECWAMLWDIPVVFYFLAIGGAAVMLSLYLIEKVAKK